MTSPDRGRPRKPVGAELILPILAASYAAYYVLSVNHFPWEAQIFGVSIAVVLWALVIWLVARNFRKVIQGAARWGDSSDLPSRSEFLKRAGFIGLAIANVALMDYLGFGLTIFLFVLLSMLLLGVRNRRMLIIMPSAVALSSYLLFIVFLQANLPTGPVESVLGWIF